MFARINNRSSIAAPTLLVLLGGCSGTSIGSVPNVASVESPSILPMPTASKKSSGGVIFTTQMYGHDANVYQRSGSQGLSLKLREVIGGLSSPSGSFSTTNGYVYISNGAAANVLVFKTKHGLPGKKAAQTLEDYNQYPVNVATTPDRNLVAVSNQGNLASVSGSVSVYLNRSDTPSSLLTYTGFGSDSLQGEGVAIDHQGDCFWSFNDLSNSSVGGAVVEFANCSGSGSLLFDGIDDIGGIAFDQRDDLFIDVQTSGVNFCSKGSYASCPQQQYVAIYGDPLNLNFDYHDKNLWVADTTGYLYAIQPGKGKSKMVGQIVLKYQTYGGASNEPFGIAPDPGD